MNIPNEGHRNAGPTGRKDGSLKAWRHGVTSYDDCDDHDSRAWVVDRIDLRAGTKERLHAQRDEAPVPYVTPDGDVRWSTTAAAASPDAPFVARLAAAGENVSPIGGGLR